MAKGAYGGVSSKARKGKKLYVGVSNVARKVKKMYIGDANSKARLCYSGYDYNNGVVYIYSGASFSGKPRVGTIDNCIQGNNYSELPDLPSTQFNGNASWYGFYWLNGYIWAAYVYNNTTNKAALLSLAKIPDTGGSAWTLVKDKEVILSNVYNPMGSVYFMLQCCYDGGTDTEYLYFMYGVINGSYTTCGIQIDGSGNYSIKTNAYSGFSTSGKTFIDDDNLRYFYLHNNSGGYQYLARSTPALGGATYIQSYAISTYGQPNIQLGLPNSFGARFVSTGQSSGYSASYDVFKYNVMKGATWISSDYTTRQFYVFKGTTYYVDNGNRLYKTTSYPGNSTYIGFYAIITVTEEAMYVGGTYSSGGFNGTIYKSTDGATFTALSSAFSNKSLQIQSNAPRGYFYW